MNIIEVLLKNPRDLMDWDSIIDAVVEGDPEKLYEEVNQWKLLEGTNKVRFGEYRPGQKFQVESNQWIYYNHTWDSLVGFLGKAWQIRLLTTETGLLTVKKELTLKEVLEMLTESSRDDSRGPQLIAETVSPAGEIPGDLPYMFVEYTW